MTEVTQNYATHINLSSVCAYVRRVCRRLRPADPTYHLEYWWTRATPTQRDAFTRANLLTAWDSIDRVTR